MRLCLIHVNTLARTIFLAVSPWLAFQTLLFKALGKRNGK